MRYTIIFLFFLISCNVDTLDEEYYGNGQLKYSIPLVNGKREGVLRQYYPDGTLMLTSEWLRGSKHGKVKVYFPNGKLQAEEYFEGGLGEGEFVYYDSITGTKIVVFTMEKGKRNGVAKGYFPNGSVEKVELYKDEIRHGRSIKYDEEGRELEKIIFENDKIIYRVKYLEGGLTTNRLLPIVFIPDKTNTNRINEVQKIKIGISQSYYDNGMVQLVVGDLDEKLNVKGITKNFASKELLVEYEFVPKSIGIYKISGLVKEQIETEGGKRKTKNMQSFNYEIEITQAGASL